MAHCTFRTRWAWPPSRRPARRRVPLAPYLFILPYLLIAPTVLGTAYLLVYPLIRNLVVFEGVLPNPKPNGSDLSGCVPVARFWAGVTPTAARPTPTGS